MTQEHYFSNAKWVGAPSREQKTFSVLRGHFSCKAGSRAELRVLGLGFFKCYINGVCINPDTFLPLSSDYEASCDPSGEVLSGHRIYVPQFDITSYIREGDNLIALHYGGGWYTEQRCFGLPKAIYSVTVENEDGVCRFGSDETCRIGESFVSDYRFTTHEVHSYRGKADCFGVDFDDSAWACAVETERLETEYCSTDCPTDALIEVLPVTKIGEGANGGIVYDCGQNTTGYVTLDLTAMAGETVTVLFSEELNAEGRLDTAHMQHQRFAVEADGEIRTVEPQFTWFGFRCFEVIGNAVPRGVKVVHAKIDACSSFACDNETLNWMYHTFLHTMLCNMHTGHPSDCPHLERRGYTGDGQLTCHAVLSTLDARAFYEKWMQDIGDCQDTLSGHVQYTAPYIRSGGGPGGWGCAIVEVPYQLYRHYGDASVLQKHYHGMRRYIDYLEAHSEHGVVTSDREGEWCLGDWCGPIVVYPDRDVTSHNQQVVLPAPMVNTYFMIKSLMKMCEIARVIGKDADIAEYEEKIAYRKSVLQAAYFNTFDHNFIMNIQGANAYAVDLGLGDQKTYQTLLNYYRKVGCYDTGIFGTDILTRVLFENGDAELAVDLMTNKGPQGYENWRRNGATTYHEYWDSNRSRSHSHPMFGAPVAYLFEYLLGIKQAPGTVGYTSLVIEPQGISRFGFIEGKMQAQKGTVSVRYEKIEGGVCITAHIPPETPAILRFGGKEQRLEAGENRLTIFA